MEINKLIDVFFVKIFDYYKRNNYFELIATFVYFYIISFALIFPFFASIGWKYDIQASIGIWVVILVSIFVTYFYFFFNGRYKRIRDKYEIEAQASPIKGWQMSLIVIGFFGLAIIILILFNGFG